MITAEHLTRKFGPLTAVDDLSFRIEPGEVVGFLGPNGAGKTTTMRMLTGYLPATSGRIEIAGHDVLRDSLAVRQQIGYLPEAVPFYREHRVSELCAFHGRLHGMERRAIRARAAEVLERVGLGDRARSLFGKLSKGQRQRVGLALALLPDPPVLILDEPTSGLDPLQRIEVRKLIGELSADRTVLLSSHILPEIEALCPRLIILNHGRVAAQGTQAELVLEHGGGSCVRLEAVVGDVQRAIELLRSIEGVDAVHDEGRLGIHQVLRIPTGVDLREEVGALCAIKGWALRELSYARPTLESIFARIALGLADTGDAPAGDAPAGEPSHAPAPGARGPAASPISSAPVAASGGGLTLLGGPGLGGSGSTEAEPSRSGPGPAAGAESARAVFNLNPFELGADGERRDLSKPKVVVRKEPRLPYTPPAPPASTGSGPIQDTDPDAGRAPGSAKAPGEGEGEGERDGD